MASTTLITYLHYMSTWDSESDANIDKIIKEQSLFLQVGDFDSDSVVESEFKTLTDLAMEVRNLTIAADATRIAANAAAVSAIWSFGLGMAAFVAAQVALIIETKVISDKSASLNNKLTTVDTDISDNINENVKNYVTQYKSNNNLIVSKAPVGTDVQTCRANLMQFMADVHRNAGKLDAPTFKTYAESARSLFNSTEINAVYDALDKLNFSNKTEADVKEYMNFLSGFQPPQGVTIAKQIITSISLAIMVRKLNIANEIIKATAREAGIPVAEVNASVFNTMDAIGKFTTVLAVVMSVVDTVFDILDIVDVVRQCERMCEALTGTIKQNYLAYFNGIRDASKQYNAAISPVPVSSWVCRHNAAEYEGASWDNFIKTINSTTVEAAMGNAAGDNNIKFFFYCRDNLNLQVNGQSRYFQKGSAVFFSGSPWYGSALECDLYEKSSV